MNFSTEFFMRRWAIYRCFLAAGFIAPVALSGNEAVDVISSILGGGLFTLNFITWPMSWHLKGKKELARGVENTARNTNKLSFRRDGEYIVISRYYRAGKSYRLWPFFGTPSGPEERYESRRFHAVEDAEDAHEYVAEARAVPEPPEAEKEAEILLQVLSGKKIKRKSLTS